MRRPIKLTILLVFVGLTFCSQNPATAQNYIGDFDPPGGRFNPKNNTWPTMWPVEVETHPSLTTKQESPLGEESNSKSNFESDSKTPETSAKEQNSKSANDPDNSQHMQVQWEMWHRRVEESISVRFNGVAQRAFTQSRPIDCEVAYTVTRDKRIVNVRLLRKSNNIVYNSMLLMVLKSMNGNPLLEFPPGSKREVVEKTGVFAHQGFTGDGFICDPPMDRQIQHAPKTNR